MSSTGDVIIATSRMGLAGSRGGGTIPQPDQAGVWRLAVDPSCAIGLCGYVVPTSPLIMFAAASQSVEEVILTPDDHLYVAVVDDRLVNQGARLGGLWAGRPDGSPLVSVGFMGADTLRNVVSVDLVAGSPTVDTVDHRRQPAQGGGDGRRADRLRGHPHPGPLGPGPVPDA